jgi:transposase
MAKTFQEWDVDQAWLLPPSVRELVPEGHVAHFVRDTVREVLELSAILDAYVEERGYPPYHPAMMTALLLYAYTQGVYSSRKVERACAERLDFMAVAAMARPDHNTINAFRKRHLKALGDLFVQVLKLCQRAGMVQLGHVALDGTKVKANASKHKAMSYGRMREVEKALASEVASWFSRADAADAEDERESTIRGRAQELPEWVKSKQQRLEKIRQAKAALEAEATEQDPEPPSGGGGMKLERPRTHRQPEAPGVPHPKRQRNFTDPESRILKTSDGYVQGYNCQAAVDSKSQVIVARSLQAAQNDAPALLPLVRQVKQNTGRQMKELSADFGYLSLENLHGLERHRIRGYIATGRQKHGRSNATGRFRGTQRNVIREMKLRLSRAGHRSRYRLRKQIAEPVFGQMKEARGFRRFSLRGQSQVMAEWSLICTAHNLLKLAGRS